MQSWFKIISPAYRKFIVIFLDIIIIFFTFLLTQKIFLHTITYDPLIFCSSYLLTSYFIGNHRKIWRFFSTIDFAKLFLTILITTLFFTVYFAYTNERLLLPYLITTPLLIFNLIATQRGMYKYMRTITPRSKQMTSRTLIIGAGEAGEQLLRESLRNATLKLNVVGFLDDAPQKKGTKIHGVQVLGKIKDLNRVVEDLEIDLVIIAIPSATQQQMHQIVEVVSEVGVQVKTLPSLFHVLEGKVSASQLKDIDPEDLLGREKVQLQAGVIRKQIKDKIIFVSGGGGSIGSELCRQIAQFTPRELIIYEQCELFLFSIEREIKSKYPYIKLRAVIGDIRDEEHVEQIINKTKPDIIFHAAAYKHVPLMESNPIEAIKTNIIGTNILSKIAVKYNINRLVLISTDKAVNPTNVMGCSKKIAEMICQYYGKKNPGKTKFVNVRFGNVLGSSGSVIPLFKEQIRKGEAITVTHPDVIRYFMSIPEASQLVLQAGSLGEGGEVFLLDMGEPVKIVDLARQMIRLSGLEPDKDIQIQYTGLRPGEKLYEELLANKELSLPTSHPKVRKAKIEVVDEEVFTLIQELMYSAVKLSEEEIIIKLKEIVPEFNHAKNN